jgi:hypothetical protein
MQMQFLRFNGEVVGDIEWPIAVVTPEEFNEQAKAALSGFYVSSKSAFWPRKLNVPEAVRIVDGKGDVIAAYTVDDFILETRRSLVRPERL